MRKFNYNYSANLKKYIMVSGAIFIAGIIALLCFGVNLDIVYRGGCRVSYSYSGEIDINEAESIIEDTIGIDAKVSSSQGINSDSTMLNISFSGNASLSTDQQESLTKALEEGYPDNQMEFGEITTVNPAVGFSFFAKCLVAVAIAAIFVILYIALRFRNIGGFSAGVMAFVALIHDILLAFFACVIFRLDIDANFVAVILTILGYSLNNTIVIYDRVRENKKLYLTESIRDIVNRSINETLKRSVMTTFTTFASLLVIIIVAELAGLTSLRSFAIPMAIGVVSGCYSSVCLSGPLWVLWCEYKDKKKKADKKADIKAKAKQ